MEAATVATSTATDRSRVLSIAVPRPREQRPLRIAMLAPPWITVPPPGYGGVESVVDALTEALVRRGHAVTLFCAPGSRSIAKVVTLLDGPPPRRDRALPVRGRPRGAGVRADRAGWRRGALRPRARPLWLHRAGDGRPPADAPRPHPARTVHRETAAFYARHGHKARLDRDQPGAARRRPGRPPAARGDPEPDRGGRTGRCSEKKDDYLLWVGRMTAGKGPHGRSRRRDSRAAARPRWGRPARPAGLLRARGRPPRRRQGGPLRRRGDRGAEALALLPGERPADADPLGGAVRHGDDRGPGRRHAGDRLRRRRGPELIVDGKTGFIVADEAAMAAAVPRLADISPARLPRLGPRPLRRRRRRGRLRVRYRSVALEPALAPVRYA